MKRMPALGRKLPHAGEVSSNPRPHQKKGGRKLSELVKQSLLPRQEPMLRGSKPRVQIRFCKRTVFVMWDVLRVPVCAAQN